LPLLRLLGVLGGTRLARDLSHLQLGRLEERFRERVRIPRGDEQREPNWRPIDPGRDRVEVPERGVDYGDSYTEDLTELYYWRRQTGG
jgi:hypothetical protein